MPFSPERTPQRGLLATKLFVPATRSGCVPRARLDAALDHGTKGPVTLVCSAAGWGKTTLLADWVRRGKRPAAWLSLDEQDSEPRRFLAYVVAALRRVVPEVGQVLADDLERPEAFDAQVGLIELVNDLVEAGQDLILVLDDLHLVEHDKIYEYIAFLIESSPPNFHLILTTRVDPPLPLSRLRARGLLTEIRAEALRFTQAEAGEFLAEAMGVALDEAVLAKLETRTEGWIAGLQMAALSMRDRPDVETFVEGFAGSHRFILDYLMEEVLAGMAADRREFLLSVSILREMSGPVVDAVTGRSDGQTMLEAFDGDNLFLVPLDDTRGAYRFHHLFGTLLRHELEATVDPQELRTLHGRAAAVLESRGAVADAFEHSIEAGDWDRAERLVTADFDALMLRRVHGPLARQLERFPQHIRATRPGLLSKQLWLAAELCRDAELEAARAAVRAALARTPHPQADGEVRLLEAMKALQANALASARQLFNDAEQLIDPQPSVLRGMLIMNRAWLDLMEDRFDAAAEAAGAIERQGIALQDEFAQLWGRWFSAHVSLLAGDVLGCTRVMDGLTRRALARYGDNPPVSTGVAFVTYGVALALRGEFESAEEWLERALETLDPQVDPGNCCFQVLAQAQLQVYRDPTGSGWRESLARGDELLAMADMPVFAERLRAHKVRHALNPNTDQEPTELATRWLAEPGIRDRTHRVYGGLVFPTTRKGFSDLVLARCLIEVGEFDPALDIAREFRDAAVEGGRTICATEGWLTFARLYHRVGDDSQTRSAIAAAVELARGDRIVGPFFEIEPALVSIAAQLARERELYEFAKALPVRGAPPEPTRPTPAPSRPQVTEGLSERELEVLDLVSDGLSNAEVGRKLFVAPSTVKKHLEHVYNKLGVRRRGQAVKRARELGLLRT